MKAWADTRAHLLCLYMWLLSMQLSEWTHREGFLTSWVIPGKASNFPGPHGTYLMARWWRIGADPSPLAPTRFIPKLLSLAQS